MVLISSLTISCNRFQFTQESPSGQVSVPDFLLSLVALAWFGYTSLMLVPIKRFGTTARWSDATVHRGVAYIVEVPTTLSADAETQSREVLAQLEATLNKVGSAKDQLLMCTIYLADMTDRAVFNEVWEAWLVAGTAPVRACVQVGLADPGYKVEIQAVAAV